MCGKSCLKAETAGPGHVSPVACGGQVLLEFGWQLGTLLERLQQENPKLRARGSFINSCCKVGCQYVARVLIGFTNNNNPQSDIKRSRKCGLLLENKQTWKHTYKGRVRRR